MYCSKCGKVLDDDAVICIGCGCPTSNYGAPPQPTMYQKNVFSKTTANTNLMINVEKHLSKASAIFILAIVGLILCWSIGFIFAIISYIMSKHLISFDKSLYEPNIQRELGIAEQKVRNSKVMNIITIIISVVIDVFLLISIF